MSNSRFPSYFIHSVSRSNFSFSIYFNFIFSLSARTLARIRSLQEWESEGNFHSCIQIQCHSHWDSIQFHCVHLPRRSRAPLPDITHSDGHSQWVSVQITQTHQDAMKRSSSNAHDDDVRWRSIWVSLLNLDSNLESHQRGIINRHRPRCAKMCGSVTAREAIIPASPKKNEIKRSWPKSEDFFLECSS